MKKYLELLHTLENLYNYGSFLLPRRKSKSAGWRKSRNNSSGV